MSGEDKTTKAAQVEPARDQSIPDSPSDLIRSLINVFTNREALTIGAAILLAIAIVWIGIDVAERFKSYREFLTQRIVDSIDPPAVITSGSEIALLPAAMLLILGLFLLAFFLYSVSALWQMRSLRKERNHLSSEKQRFETGYLEAASERDRLSGANKELASQRDSIREMFEKEREVVQATLTARNVRLQRTLNGSIRAASMIQNQLFPAVANGAGKSFEFVKFIYYANKCFDVEVRRQYRIRAGKTPIHFWQNSISVSPYAGAVETFADINFRIASLSSGKDLVYLPTRNEPLKKSACIFFLPRIEPGEARDIEVSYSWPKMAQQLKAQGWEDYSVRLVNTENLGSYCVEFYLEAGTGGSLACNESGALLPNKSLEQAVSHHGWQGWRYSAANIPPEILNDRISLRVEWIES
jgi:hypothetical protein